MYSPINKGKTTIPFCRRMFDEGGEIIVKKVNTMEMRSINGGAGWCKLCGE